MASRAIETAASRRRAWRGTGDLLGRCRDAMGGSRSSRGSAAGQPGRDLERVHDVMLQRGVLVDRLDLEQVRVVPVLDEVEAVPLGWQEVALAVLRRPEVEPVRRIGALLVVE